MNENNSNMNSASNTTQNGGFNYNEDVCGVLDYITNDKHVDGLTAAIYDRRGSAEESVLNYLLNITFPPEVKNASDVVDTLRNDEDYLETFVSRLIGALLERVDPGKKNDLMHRLTLAEFWRMYGVSIKKCLGEGFAEKQISEPVFFDVIPNDINKYQRKAHNEALQSFNYDGKDFSFKKTKDLKFYLHPIRSRNTSPKTRKKNIHRVERQAKRIIQIYGLRGRGEQFTEGRHEVPKQFAKGIIKTCVNKK